MPVSYTLERLVAPGYKVYTYLIGVTMYGSWMMGVVRFNHNISEEEL